MSDNGETHGRISRRDSNQPGTRSAGTGTERARASIKELHGTPGTARPSGADRGHGAAGRRTGPAGPAPRTRSRSASPTPSSCCCRAEPEPARPAPAGGVRTATHWLTTSPSATMVAAENGLALEHVQSDYEGALVEAVHEARGRAAAIA